MNEDRYISSAYSNKHPTWHIEDSKWKAQQIIKIINKNKIKPKTIADVGCGAGEVLFQLYKKLETNIYFTGFEISPYALELAKTRERDRLSFIKSDITINNKSFFDVILLIDVIEHIEDIYSFLRKIKTKSKYKILHVPLDLSVQTIIRVSPILNQRKSVGHVHYFIKETILELLRETGYEVIDSYYTSGSIDLHTKTMISKFAKIPRRIMFKINQNFAVKLLGGFSLIILAK